MKGKVIIIMGSERDHEFSREIAKTLGELDISHVFRVGSAHKTPQKVLKILNEYGKERVVYVTVAGRSNALSAFVDANTVRPVIACPPYSERYCGVDIYSSLRVPSGIGSIVTIEPEGAALAAAKILAICDEALERRIEKYQSMKRQAVEEADEAIGKMK